MKNPIAINFLFSKIEKQFQLKKISLFYMRFVNSILYHVILKMKKNKDKWQSQTKLQGQNLEKVEIK